MITCRETRTSDEVSKADGLSNSIMYGENNGSRFIDASGQARTRYRQIWASGGVAKGTGLVEFGDQPTRLRPLLGHAFTSSAFGFGSFHPAGVNFAKGDGSVETLARSIDTEVFYALCGAFDTQ